MDAVPMALTFGTVAFLITVIPSAVLILVSSLLLRWGFGRQSVVDPAVRQGLAERPVRTLRAVLAARGKRALPTVVLVALLVAACYGLVFLLLLGVAADWKPPVAVLAAITVPLGFAAAIPSCLYVATGGRRGGGLYPPLPVRPWTIAGTVRVAAAVRIVRQVQLELVTTAGWIATFWVINKRSDVSDADAGLLYLVGAVPMFLLAWAWQARLPMVQPRAAAHRLLLQVLADAPQAGMRARGGAQAGMRAGLGAQAGMRAGRGAPAITGPARAQLMTVCRLLERAATVESRAEAAGGVQNVGALTLRGAAAQLRAFLSNRASLTRPFDGVRDDLALIAAVLARPRSAAALTELGTRMGAFEADGSLKEAYRATHRNLVAAGFEGLAAGLDRTHQLLLRGAVIALVVLALVQFATGKMALSDLFKSVKL